MCTLFGQEQLNDVLSDRDNAAIAANKFSKESAEIIALHMAISTRLSANQPQTAPTDDPNGVSYTGPVQRMQQLFQQGSKQPDQAQRQHWLVPRPPSHCVAHEAQACKASCCNCTSNCTKSAQLAK